MRKAKAGGDFGNAVARGSKQRIPSRGKPQSSEEPQRCKPKKRKKCFRKVRSGTPVASAMSVIADLPAEGWTVLLDHGHWRLSGW
jgi:hypothetical protein